MKGIDDISITVPSVVMSSSIQSTEGIEIESSHHDAMEFAASTLTNGNCGSPLFITSTGALHFEFPMLFLFIFWEALPYIYGLRIVFFPFPFLLFGSLPTQERLHLLREERVNDGPAMSI